MLFSVEQDQGGFIGGYVVGDGFDGSRRIVATSEGVVRYEGAADSPREALVTAGRHRTGRCGFELDEAKIPGLSAMLDLEIHDEATGLLIYRRRRPQHRLRRVLRLETHLFPLWRIDAAVNDHFQYYANRIEAYGRETATQMFLLNKVASVYLSGRLFYRPFQPHIEGRFDVLFAMHEPYEELAERLIVLSQIKSTGATILDPRETESLAPAMTFAQRLPIEDERRLAQAFREIPEAVARALDNPVTRQLAAATPDETLDKTAVPRALTALASFAAVGLNRAPKAFNAAVAELCGLDVAPPQSAPLPGVSALARVLRRAREAERLLEQDLALYAQLVGAYRARDEAAPGVPGAPRTV